MLEKVFFGEVGYPNLNTWNMEKKKSGIDTASLDFTLAKKDHYVTESDIVLEVYENERFDLQTRTWGPHNLKSTDPKRYVIFSSAKLRVYSPVHRYQHSSGQSDVFPEPPVPEGFAPMGDW